MFFVGLISGRVCQNIPLLCKTVLYTKTVKSTFSFLTPAVTAFQQPWHTQSVSVHVHKKLSQTTWTVLLQNPSASPFHLSVHARNFSTSLPRSAKELSEKGDVVYKGAIAGMIRGVKIFSLSTSVIGISLQPMLLFSNQELPAALKFAVGGFLNFFIFMNPIIIHYIAKKYVTELRWNRTTGVFTAATWSFLAQRKELQFMAEDVKVPDMPGMFTLLEAKGVPLFMEPQAFLDNDAYIHLMGFDKPLDWELPAQGVAEGKSESQKNSQK